MDHLECRRLGKTELELPVLGMGVAPLGNLFVRLSGSQSQAILQAAWDGGIRYFDTSPFYGHGRSEHRLGHFLQDQPRNAFVVSTKVGRLLNRIDGDSDSYQTDVWTAPLPFDFRFDYSYDGVMRSYEDSMHRLGLNRIDILLIHDLDRMFFTDEKQLNEKLKELDGGFKALDQLRSSGEIRAVGSGINLAETIPEMLARFDLDCLLVAMPYTLLDQKTLDEQFPECGKRGVGVIIGAPYASGILATGPVAGAKYKYAIAESDILEKVDRMSRIGERHGVTLASAAVQFPLAHPLVASVIPGAVDPSHVEATIQATKATIPLDFWKDLKAEGLIRTDAPVPV